MTGFPDRTDSTVKLVLRLKGRKTLLNQVKQKDAQSELEEECNLWSGNVGEGDPSLLVLSSTVGLEPRNQYIILVMTYLMIHREIADELTDVVHGRDVLLESLDFLQRLHQDCIISSCYGYAERGRERNDAFEYEV